MNRCTGYPPPPSLSRDGGEAGVPTKISPGPVRQIYGASRPLCVCSAQPNTIIQTTRDLEEEEEEEGEGESKANLIKCADTPGRPGRGALTTTPPPSQGYYFVKSCHVKRRNKYFQLYISTCNLYI